jgi:ribosomal protein S18 acetylase RimI-like enzyme
MVRLEPIDETAFRASIEVSIREYAAEKVEAGTWQEADSLERATGEFDRLLPNGRATAGHEIRSIVNDTGERVGMVWFTLEQRPIGRVVFIYDLSVEPAHRRRGYAMGALEAVAAYAREHDCIGVQLHVFGSNVGARELYRRAGFVETDVMMLKRVDG